MTDPFLPPPTELLLLVSVKASFVVGAVYALTWLARERSAALRSCLWAVGFAGLVGVFIAQLWGPSLPAVPLLPAETPHARNAVSASLVVDSAVPISSAPAPAADLSSLSLVWLAGVLALSMLWLRAVIGASGLRRRGSAAPPHIQRAAHAAATAVGCGRPIVVRLANVAMPCMFGLWRGTILLPHTAVHWDAEQLRNALLHEVAHARRSDYATHLLSLMARALYWPNPLVWWATRRARLECEHACDDLVLAQGVRGPHYAEDLLQFARRAQPALAGATLSMGCRSTLARRVRAVLARRRDRRPMTGAGRMAVVALVSIATAPALLGWRAAEDDEAVDAALAQLTSGDVATRQYAAWRLGELESIRGVQPLITRLADPAAEVRGVAAWALGEIKDPRAIPHLANLLEDPDAAVIDMAARALGECGAESELPRLSRLIGAPDPRVGAAAAFALGEIGTDEAVRELHTGLGTNPEPHVVAATLRALGIRRAAAAATDMVTHLDDADPLVRAEAARALGRIGDERAVPHLLPLLRDPDATVRDSASWSLDEIDAER